MFVKGFKRKGKQRFLKCVNAGSNGVCLKMVGTSLRTTCKDIHHIRTQNIVIISCRTCCLVGPIKATWVCASFDSKQSHHQLQDLLPRRIN